MEECVILVLKERRIKVNKGKLADKSHYFSSLYSHNFRDSRDKEHIINYNIALCTLQNFVDWIHNEGWHDINHHDIKASMTKFVGDNFVELLSLLQVSVLFTVDELTNDIIDIIILHWLSPKKVIEIWLLAQELSIRVLQDVCLSFCLDRFEELPISALVKLSKDNIIQLIENVNTRSSAEYLIFVRDEWMKHAMISEIANVKQERHPKLVHGTVVYPAKEDVNRIAHVYICHDSVLSKCVQLKHTQGTGKYLIGMQVVGRGFSLYTVGGEMGLGTGWFNDIIWRYCLLSRKWYYQERLPVPRRHMVAVFIKNKLIIVGGVGRYRVRLFTVDILDIHAGSWKSGNVIPECFSDVPPHCVMNDKLFLLTSSVYIYDPQKDFWEIILFSNYSAIRNVNAFLTYDTTLFMIGNHLGETALSRFSVVQETACEKEECSRRHIKHSVITCGPTVFEDLLYRLRCVRVDDAHVLIVNNQCDDKDQYLHIDTEIRRDLENSFIRTVASFNIIDPETLYDTA